MTELNSELLPVLPLDDVVVLPHMTVTLALADDAQKAAVDAAGRGNRLVLLVPRVEGRFARMGTVARVESSGRLPTGADVAILKGERRGRPGGGQADIDGALWVQVEPVEDPEGSERVRELAREYRALLENVLESRGAPGAVQFVRNARTASHLADLAGYSPELSVEQKIEVLETVDVEERLTRLIEWTKQNLADASLKEQIRSEVTEGMEKTQREFLLRQQMEAIRKQLGEGSGDVVSGYRTRVEEAGMPDGVRTEVERELDRLERTSEQNPEYGWIRTYLDWMLELPWNVRSEDNYDLHEARRILDEDHTGLDDVKDRILEFLAVRKLREERGLEVIGGRGSGAIITLVGPPGVGKTSLGESVARALGRKFARVSLGGVHDEAEIRGHRRTYIGALPGRIVRALKEAGTKNPVIMLDEIDKVGADWRGDPSAALLEVLDPAQNHSFRDHYLEVDLDLSEVLFIPTANVWETIPAPLLDRMELIRLDGYTEQEKVAIAR
ncbi:MAG: AAA family ATPase, partial [Chloroflexi bacterium]